MPQINYTAMAFWFSVLQWVAMVALAIWTYLRTKDRDNAGAIAKVATELADFIKASRDANESQNHRLTQLEERLEHMPTDREIGDLTAAVADVRARLDGVAESLRGLQHQTSVISQHLLSNKS